MQAVVRRLSLADHQKERVMLARCTFTILDTLLAAIVLVVNSKPKAHDEHRSQLTASFPVTSTFFERVKSKFHSSRHVDDRLQSYSFE